MKWEGKGAEYCSAWAKCLNRGKKDIQKNGPLCVPIPSNSTYPVYQSGKTRERTEMEPKRMNSDGSTSGQYYGCFSFWGMFPRTSIFVELINGTLSLGPFTSSLEVNFARYKPINSCHPEGLIYFLGHVVCTYICYCRLFCNTSLNGDFSFESIWDMREGRRVSTFSEFHSYWGQSNPRMKRPGFRVPGSVVRITLQDFMTYRHEQYG